MKSPVRKAIIPAAGLGTRFLPATKTVPKEMLPIVDRPTLLYVVEEAVSAGIEDIVIVAGRGKHAIEDFFDTSYEIESWLEQHGHLETLASLKKISNMANIISLRQKRAGGLGHAVLCAKSVIGENAFAVLLGDELTRPQSPFSSVTAELMTLFEHHGRSTTNIIEVAAQETGKYGIVSGRELPEKHKGCTLMQVTEVIEKPAPGQTSSRWALPGRYVFGPELFDALENTAPGRNNELQLSDAMSRLAKNEGLLAARIPHVRYDAGDKLGYLRANIELALERPDLRPEMIEYLKSLVATLSGGKS